MLRYGGGGGGGGRWRKWVGECVGECISTYINGSSACLITGFSKPLV